MMRLQRSSGGALRSGGHSGSAQQEAAEALKLHEKQAREAAAADEAAARAKALEDEEAAKALKAERARLAAEARAEKAQAERERLLASGLAAPGQRSLAAAFAGPAGARAGPPPAAAVASHRGPGTDFASNARVVLGDEKPEPTGREEPTRGRGKAAGDSRDRSPRRNLPETVAVPEDGAGSGSLSPPG